VAEGSNVLIGIKSGLFEQEHLDGMGQAIWLYGILHELADWESGLVLHPAAYIYEQLAARYEATTDKTFRRWMERLSQRGYIQQNEHAIQITNYHSIRTWFRDRALAKDAKAEPGTKMSETTDKNVQTDKNVPTGTKMSKARDKNVPSYIIYKISNVQVHYRGYADMYEAALKAVAVNKNPIAVLTDWYRFLAGSAGMEAEDRVLYGRLGSLYKLANRDGRRLVQVLALAIAQHPVGDVLNYADAMLRRKGKAGDGDTSALEEWARQGLPKEGEG